MTRIGFDVGGTFTDVVLLTRNGRMHTAKVLTTHDDPARGCLLGLAEVVGAAGVSWAEVTQVVHGTTLGSNAVIERSATGIALVTTAGFRDVLTLGREKRYQVYDLQIVKPAPLVDRADTYEVTERVLADGTVHVPLDEAQARGVLRELVARGVRSVAVCLLHSYASPVHERRFAELAAQEAPGLAVSLSSDVSPQVREYERMSTTVVNAYLVPTIRAYLAGMVDALAGRGYTGRLFVTTSSGGVATAEAMGAQPVTMIESGPAAGALMAAEHGRLAGRRDGVAFDMGGTTAKLALVADGALRTVGEFELHRVRMAPGSGIPMTVRSVDVVEIGAGGGSIARVVRGVVEVGPDSAGSSPGPACYGAGGTDATVTDANLVLGYLGDKIAGSMPLDVDAARAALERSVATPLGISVPEAAWCVHAMVTSTMELATRVVSIERGHDPRQLALIATGGCGPMHACRLAAALGMPAAVLPPAAGVASALGMLSAQVRADADRTARVRLPADPSAAQAAAAAGDADARRVADLLAGLVRRASAAVRDASGAPPVRVACEADVRYAGQGYDIAVPVPAGPVDLLRLRHDFDAAYARRYGYALPGEAVDATTWRVTAYGPEPQVTTQRSVTATGPVEDAVTESRPVWFPETGGYVDTPVYRRDALAPGHRLAGPAVVEDPASTAVLPPGTTATVTADGALLVTVTP